MKSKSVHDAGWQWESRDGWKEIEFTKGWRKEIRVGASEGRIVLGSRHSQTSNTPVLFG